MSKFIEAALVGRKLEDVSVIDIHGHMGPWCLARTFATSASDMVGCMDSIGVDAICVSAFLSITADPRLGNDIIGDAIRDFPGRFIGYATINPHYPDSVVPELSRCFDQLDMRGLKFHPAWHDHPVDSPSYRSALDFASERGAFVLSHTWGSPSVLTKFAERYPNVRFIIAHQASLTGGVVPGRGWSEVMRDLPNVYADLASSLAPMGGFEALVEAVGAEKILFGSDTPLHDLAFQIGRVLFADISDEDKAGILGLNALRVIGA